MVGLTTWVVVVMSRYALKANYDCPKCDRPTLGAVPDEIAAYKCAVCNARVREGDMS